MKVRVGLANRGFRNHVVVQTSFAFDGGWAHGGALVIPRRVFEDSFLAKLAPEEQIECELTAAEEE